MSGEIIVSGEIGESLVDSVATLGAGLALPFGDITVLTAGGVVPAADSLAKSSLISGPFFVKSSLIGCSFLPCVTEILCPSASVWLGFSSAAVGPLLSLVGDSDCSFNKSSTASSSLSLGVGVPEPEASLFCDSDPLVSSSCRLLSLGVGVAAELLLAMKLSNVGVSTAGADLGAGSGSCGGVIGVELSS